MLAKRIIPCLDIKDGQTVKGTNFVNLRQAGDPVELGRAYSEQGADELVFLDITASHEGRKTFTELVKRIAANINIPFTVGGGINELSDVDRLLNAGADKISINSSAIRNPQLTDYGGGLDPAFADSIFEPFITSKNGGSGLGLVITKQIVESHHGTIHCDSRPGDGCTFTLTLPLTQS